MVERKEVTTKTRNVCINCKRRKSASGGNAATGWILNIGSCKCGEEFCAESSNETTETSTRFSATVSGDSQPGAETQRSDSEPSTIPQDEIPKSIDNRFELLSVLGKGGMGTVYKVRDQQVGNIFALKLLHQNLQSDPSVLKRFEQEAKAAEQLDHPNLVPTYAHGITKNGAPYLLIEYVEGETLAQIIEREGALEDDRAISIFEQICAALSYAHEMKIVHRDIKPANIIVSKTPSGEEVVRVVDFGIAKTLTEVDRSTRNLTQTGEVFGSPHYMSPEQCLGLMLDEKSDIYSLGCVMFEALSGKPPFAGSNPIQLVVKHINDKPTPYLPKLGASRKAVGLQSVSLKCLNKEPGFRFETVTEIAEALSNIKEGRRIVFDHSFAIQSAKLERNLQKIALYLPLLLVACAFTIVLFSLAPGLLENADTRFMFALQFGFYSFLCGLAAVVCAALARTCMVLAQTGKLTRANAWSTMSLLFCSLMLVGTIPASLFFISAHRWRSPAIFEFHRWDWLTIVGLIVSVFSCIGVLISSLGYAYDRGPTKVRFDRTAWKAILCTLLLTALTLVVGHNQVGYLTGRTGDWFSRAPKPLTSGVDLLLTKVARQLSPRDLQVLEDSAEVSYSEGKYEDAIKYFSEFAKTFLEEYPKERGWAHAVYRIGEIHQKRGNLRLAIESYTRLIENSDSGIWGLWAMDWRGDCYMSLHQPTLAVDDYDSLIAKSAADTNVYLKKAVAWEELGDLQEARNAINFVNKRFVLKDPRILLRLAYISELEGELVVAKSKYKEALEMRCSKEEWTDLAKTIAALQLNDEKAAIEHFKKVKSSWFFDRDNLEDILRVYPAALRNRFLNFVEAHKLL